MGAWLVLTRDSSEVVTAKMLEFNGGALVFHDEDDSGRPWALRRAIGVGHWCEVKPVCGERSPEGTSVVGRGCQLEPRHDGEHHAPWSTHGIRWPNDPQR